MVDGPASEPEAAFSFMMDLIEAFPLSVQAINVPSLLSTIGSNNLITANTIVHEFYKYV